jgi:predicted AlkP superfamily pyrophosphatase or phosphodiesterase
MSDTRNKLLVLQVAALSREVAADGLSFAPIETVFPAVTCSVQASLRTALSPGEHGMVANGRYFPELHRVMFWEQSASLYAGDRIWAQHRAKGGSAGQMFFQQSLGEDVDLTLSPAPIHKHHGGMIDTCYATPDDLYDSLCESVGGKFKLRNYWGPLASPKVGDWIADATAALLRDESRRPAVLFSYLPTLDYDLQRFGPDDPRCAKSYAALERQLATILPTAREQGYEIVVCGDYAITPATHAVYPNRALAQAGLFATRHAGGMSYPDFHTSRAFAVVDHEVAHVHVPNAADIPAAREALAGVEGIADILTAQEAGLAHANSGQLILLASEGAWLAYPWWRAGERGPDYASHIDIHNKPGFDPCELFFAGWPPMSISQDTSKVRGTHGRAGADRPVVFATTLPLADQPSTLIDLASEIRDWLNRE